ncbi:hypothetical protein ONS96_014875 [Cadophora gregata f. sp. sojae]|nr:hypothetical protein ONS96_014875 [Cadophora gregata f. sp. sojae]
MILEILAAEYRGREWREYKRQDAQLTVVYDGQTSIPALKAVHESISSEINIDHTGTLFNMAISRIAPSIAVSICSANSSNNDAKTFLHQQLLPRRS